MKYYFPIHLNGGNRGCEAIAKGTALILKENKENLIGLCTDMELDRKLGVDKYVTLQPFREHSLIFRVKNRIYKGLYRSNKWKSQLFAYHYEYDSFLNQLGKKDVMFSTGGDMMCYSENQVIYTVNYLQNRGIHSVLWGCSIGENNLTPLKIDSLKHFSVIYARESLTKEVLLNHGMNNVVVYPDPAFVLKPEICQLPPCFKRNEVIGLNLSNYVMGGFGYDTMFAQEVDSLIQYILENTDKQILLIPHVLWKNQDDRIISKLIKEKYNSSDRISVLDVYNLNYCQIRYVISNCYCFIGARTHAVISAYSTNTPAIAIGYSIKSKGIAKDIGMPSETIVDSKNIKRGQLLESFKYVIENNCEIRNFLSVNMVKYCAEAWNASSVINMVTMN